MSKGTILTSGYINFVRVLPLLLDGGYNLVKLYSFCEGGLDAREDYNLIMQEELKKEGFEVDGIHANRYSSFSIDDDLVKTFSFGGRLLTNDDYFLSIVENELSATTAKINAAYRFVNEWHKEHNFVAALLHADVGPLWYPIIYACRELDIPTFMCYNGAVTECIPKQYVVPYYSTADVYYLHGQYAVDWLRSRFNYSDSYPVVGNPSFDSYYLEEAPEVEEDTFLYNSKTIFSKYLSPLDNIAVLLDKAQSSLISRKLSTNMDIVFFKAFAKFQQDIYPEAKLIISLRPYYTASKEDYTNFTYSFGVRNFKVIPFPETPVCKLLPAVEHVVTGISTVAVEGVLNRKSILLLPGEESDYSSYRYEKEWAVCPADMSSDSIIDGLCRVVECRDELRNACDDYASYYNFDDDGKASERLVEDLIRRL